MPKKGTPQGGTSGARLWLTHPHARKKKGLAGTSGRLSDRRTYRPLTGIIYNARQRTGGRAER